MSRATRSASIWSRTPPHLHFSPARLGGSTRRQFMHLATWKITLPLMPGNDSTPRKTCIRTLLPEPLLPRIPTDSPSSITRFILRRATTSPNRTVRSRISIKGAKLSCPINSLECKVHPVPIHDTMLLKSIRSFECVLLITIVTAFDPKDNGRATVQYLILKVIIRKNKGQDPGRISIHKPFPLAPLSRL